MGRIQTITGRITVLPVVLILFVALILAGSRYVDERATLLSALQVQTEIAARPILVLMDVSVSGGNYANVKTDDARALYAADARVLAFTVTGKTNGGEAFGVAYDGQTRHVIRTEFAQDALETLTTKLKKADDRLATLSPDHDMYGRIKTIRDGLAADHTAIMTDRQRWEEFQTKYSLTGDGVDSHHLYRLHLPIGQVGTLSLLVDATQIMDQIRSALVRNALISTISVLVAGGLMVVLARSIVRPLRRLTDATRQIADGQLETDIPMTQRRDELGELALALSVFRRNAQDRHRLEQQALAHAAQRQQRQNEIQAATEAFDHRIALVIQGIKAAVQSVHQSADILSTTAQRTERQSAEVATATEIASQRVESVAAAGTELTQSIRDISGQVQRSSAMTEDATHEVADASHKIQGLSDATQRIGDVVQMIRRIANQTNMLALNATIESARAGDAGNGFAVVANEVKHLASQTAQATEDISNQILSVQRETDLAVGAIESIARTMSRLHQVSMGIASAVEQQGTATADISSHVDHVSNSTRDVSATIGAVAVAAAETGHMSQTLFQSANQLLQDCTGLEREVNQFLDIVRA